jgi:small subunit ribosomal protein S6
MVLMLDPVAPEERRDEVASETRKRIESGGELQHADTWGTRKMAFEIAQRTEADYRFYRFNAGADLLEQLDHSLKIADGVLRFRIFKVDSGSPMIAPPATAQPAGVSARVSRAESRRAEAAAQAAQAEQEGAEAEQAGAEAEAEAEVAEPPAEAAEAAEAEVAEPPAEAAEAAEAAAPEADAEQTEESPAEPDNPQAAG